MIELNISISIGLGLKYTKEIAIREITKEIMLNLKLLINF
ncbi:hypothetical protein [Riemerella phage vB_RanS_PT15]|nr:hypothetical protein [Riemerella phage vB_RanS_PT03]UUJ74599.1 hypothetical protein [Riemerella phage vB_RanS_PT15]